MHMIYIYISYNKIVSNSISYIYRYEIGPSSIFVVISYISYTRTYKLYSNTGIIDFISIKIFIKFS